VEGFLGNERGLLLPGKVRDLSDRARAKSSAAGASSLRADQEERSERVTNRQGVLKTVVGIWREFTSKRANGGV